MFASAPPYLLAAITVLADKPQSCVKLAISDMEWIHARQRADFGMPDPSVCFDDVVRRIVMCLPRLTNLVKRARSMVASFFSVTTLARDLHDDLLQRCNAYFFPAVGGGLILSAPDPSVEGHYTCWCGNMF